MNTANLLDSAIMAPTGFLPHGICLTWKSGLIWLHVVSDGLIAAAYFSIPFGLAYFVHARKDLEYRWIFMLFAAFILACGTTHLFDIWTLWHPDYLLQGLIKAMTAVISVTSAILLWPVIKKALRIPSPRQLALINDALQTEIEMRRETVKELQHEARERQALEQKLRENQARLEAVLDTTVEGILYVNPDGSIELSNAAAMRLFGLQETDIGHLDLHDLILEKDFKPSQAAKGNPNEEPVALTGRHRNGASFPIEMSIGQMRSGITEAAHHACVVRDLTERRKTEALVREKESQLKEQQNQLAHMQRLYTAGELAAMMSHEINQPLAAIVNYLGGVSVRFRELLDTNPDFDRALEESIRMTKRVSQIIQGIRNLVRKRQNPGEIVDLKALLEETLELLGNELRKRQIYSQIAIETPSSQMFGERVQLQQLFLNLIMNAAEALEQTLSEARRLEITLTLPSKDMIQVAVTDNGPGIHEDAVQKLFEPFYSTKSNGIGLGLSICKSIVEAHGGEIAAASMPHYTRFTVQLPRTGNQTS